MQAIGQNNFRKQRLVGRDCRSSLAVFQFNDIIPGLSRSKVIFQGFPGPNIFKKNQDFPGGMGTLISGDEV